MSKRSDITLNKYKPGPGSYNNLPKEHSVGCVIGRSKKLEEKREKVPGPADYVPLVESIGGRRTQSYYVLMILSRIGRAKRMPIFGDKDIPGPADYFMDKETKRMWLNLSRVKNSRVLKTTRTEYAAKKKSISRQQFLPQATSLSQSFAKVTPRNSRQKTDQKYVL